MSSKEGENDIKTADGNHEDAYDDDPDFIQQADEELDEDLALEAQDSFDQDPAYPTYLYDQERRSGGKIENTHCQPRFQIIKRRTIFICFFIIFHKNMM